MESKRMVTVMMLALGAAMACGQAPPRSGSDDLVIQAWLRCEECTNGELEAVVRLGQAAVPTFGSALRNGPSQPALDDLRKRAVTSYQAMIEYAKTHPNAPIPMSEKDYVNREEDNFIVLYQSRSVTALRAIGGPDAKRELTQAQGLPLRPAVLAAVQEALNGMP